MANHIWTVLCRRAVVDGETNSLSLFDIIEEITVTTANSIPSDQWSVMPVEITFVSLLSRTDISIPENTRLRLEIVAPDSKVFDSEPPLIDVDLTKYERMRAITRLATVPHRGFGVHNFVFYMERSGGAWREVAKIPLHLKEIIRTEPAAVVPASSKRPSAKA